MNNVSLDIIYFLFSPCSGLVVSGYSKTPTDESFKTNIAEVIEPYKKLKIMYKVDTTGDFKGIVCKWTH